MVGPFGFFVNEGSIWNGKISILYFILHKSIYIHVVHDGTITFDKYITSDYRNKYMDADVSGFSKTKGSKAIQFKISKTYSNQYYVLKMTM